MTPENIGLIVATARASGIKEVTLWWPNDTSMSARLRIGEKVYDVEFTDTEVEQANDPGALAAVRIGGAVKALRAA